MRDAAAEVQAKLDECYIAVKVNEKLGVYGAMDGDGHYVCHGLAMALAIVKNTDAIEEWQRCQARFTPDSVAFAEQEARMREILGSKEGA